MLKGQFTYKFEELPLMQLGPRLVAALVDGSALIEFDDPGGWTIERIWTIRRIWIEAALIPRIGEKGRVELVELYENEPVLEGTTLFAAPFLVVKSALEHVMADDIAETVGRALRGEVVS
jgi:hypothetical protein